MCGGQTGVCHVCTFLRSFSAASISALMVLSNLFNNFGFFFFAGGERERRRDGRRQKKMQEAVWVEMPQIFSSVCLNLDQFLPFSLSFSSACFPVVPVTHERRQTSTFNTQHVQRWTRTWFGNISEKRNICKRPSPIALVLGDNRGRLAQLVRVWC